MDERKKPNPGRELVLGLFDTGGEKVALLTEIALFPTKCNSSCESATMNINPHKHTIFH